MKNNGIPVEVIAHFDIRGKITPYKIKYEQDGTNIMYISRLLKRDVNKFAGIQMEVYECAAQKENREILFALNYEKKLNKWFLTKI